MIDGISGLDFCFASGWQTSHGGIEVGIYASASNPYCVKTIVIVICTLISSAQISIIVLLHKPPYSPS